MIIINNCVCIRVYLSVNDNSMSGDFTIYHHLYYNKNNCFSIMLQNKKIEKKHLFDCYIFINRIIKFTLLNS